LDGVWDVAIKILCSELALWKDVWTLAILYPFTCFDLFLIFGSMLYLHSLQEYWDFIQSVCHNASKTLPNPAGPVFLTGGAAHSVLEWLPQEGRALCT
jgi:hypothetical protein